MPKHSRCLGCSVERRTPTTVEKLKDYLAAARQFSSPTVVTGHAAPDTDAAVCAVMEGWRRYVTTGEHTLPILRCDRLPAEIACLFGDLAPLLSLGDTPALTDPTVPVVLTDTNDEPTLAARVRAVVDHHVPTATLDGIDGDIRRVGATATIVADRLRQQGIEPDDTVARLLLGGIWMDTDGLSVHKATDADCAMSDWLAARCDTSPHQLYATLQDALLGERDVETLYQRDYRRYYGDDGSSLVGFAILKVRQGALPDRAAVRRLLAADVASSGARVCVAKIILYAADGTREEHYLAAGDAATTLLARVREVAGEHAAMVATDEVYLPSECVHRGRKWYAQFFKEWV